MMETIAVYWEPLIKTYGLDIQKNLAMVSFSADLKQICAYWHRCFRLFSPANRMVLAFARPEQPKQPGGLRLHLLLSGACDIDHFRALADDQMADDQLEKTIRLDKPVDLIQFHGPHFGDRYGIAAAALAALESMQVPVKAAACCGACVYLVLQADHCQTACQALSTAFVVPTVVKKSD